MNKGLAKTTVDQLFGMTMQSGPAATISAMGKLPVEIQAQSLANDAEAMRRSFDLEDKNIDAEERDREAQRKHELALRQHEIETRKLELEADARTTGRTYNLALIGLIGYVLAVLWVLYKEKWDVGAPMVTFLIGGAAGGAAGYGGGRERGYKAGVRDGKSRELNAEPKK